MSFGRLLAAGIAAGMTAAALWPEAGIPVFGELCMVLSLVGLFIHEPGHLILGPLGEFIGILGGTLFEAGIPLLGAVVLFWRRKPVAAWSCIGFAGFALLGVSRYIEDAQARKLPLWGDFGMGGVTHDWHYLLTHLGLLHYHRLIAELVYLSAAALMVAGVLGMVFAPERLMFSRRKTPEMRG